MRTAFPLVSVIVPVYNAASTLDRCVRSILNQTYAHLEVLLVNDGSKDGSLGMLQSFAEADPRVKVFAQRNSGVSAARNLGLRHAAGEFVQFVDSDDALPPDATGQMVKAMETGQTDLVIGRYHELIQGKRHLRGYLKTDMLLSQRSLLQKLTLHPNSFYYAVLWNKLYRRGVIDGQKILFDPSLPWGEDFAFNTRYMAHIRAAAILTESVYDYTRNLKGLSLTTGRRTLIHPIYSIRVKLALHQYYKNLFMHTGLYQTYRRVLPRYLFGITIFD